MLFRAKRALGRMWFGVNCRALLSTPPIHSTDVTLTLVSMLCHGEVVMYLLAVKSFCGQIGRNPKAVILDDGSLTKSDYAILRTHLPDARIVSLSEVAPGRCPKGSCSERLLLIGDLAKDTYVVQLDSDTLTTKSIAEVAQCIDANRSFTLLGDGSYPEIEPMLSACHRSKSNMGTMVQAVCERSVRPSSGERCVEVCSWQCRVYWICKRFYCSGENCLVFRPYAEHCERSVG